MKYPEKKQFRGKLRQGCYGRRLKDKGTRLHGVALATISLDLITKGAIGMHNSSFERLETWSKLNYKFTIYLSYSFVLSLVKVTVLSTHKWLQDEAVVFAALGLELADQS